jgi:hypothetical protein
MLMSIDVIGQLNPLGITECCPIVLKKIWKDSIVSNVLGGVITAAILGIATYLGGLWPTIATVASKIISLMAASTLVPNWLLVPLCLLAAYGVFILLAARYRRARGPNWRDYRQDTFSDIVWRWRYSTYDNSVRDLTAYCPRCDTQLLQAQKSSMPYHPSQTIYHCRRCNVRTEIRQNVNDVLTDVSLEIDRKRRQMSM